ncbi:MAG: hypothetical protein N3B16_00975 [Candidatus Aminicenantes bacterium]|nr:hypothetical protein [Candidatus Aminicenantes bacterium]
MLILTSPHFKKKVRQIIFFPIFFSPIISYLSLVGLLLSGCSFFVNQRGLKEISLPPASIKTISGYFSFRLDRDGSIVRGKALLWLDSTSGRLEIRDPVGRLVLVSFWTKHLEWLIIPAERAYWSGRQGQAKLMAELIAIPLEPVEIIAWIIREGKGLETLAESVRLDWAIKGREVNSDWQVEWDEEGKLKKGCKGDLKIEIQELTKNKNVTRLLSFSHPKVKGKLTVLALNFNQPLLPDYFRADKLINSEYQALSWEQIKSRLKIN